MLSLMVFIVGHCRYSSFLTIWLLGVASGVSDKVLLGLPGHMVECAPQPAFNHDFFFFFCSNLPSWYPNAVEVKQLYRIAVPC